MSAAYGEIHQRSRAGHARSMTDAAAAQLSVSVCLSVVLLSVCQEIWSVRSVRSGQVWRRSVTTR